MLLIGSKNSEEKSLTMADQGIDVSKLPLEVRAKLAELDLELSEGKAPLQNW